MRFMMLVKHAENQGFPPKELMDAIMKLSEDETKSGKMLGTGGLKPLAQGARVRLAGGKITVTDGPYAEAKEVIGGYAQFELKSKEEAVQWASRCPAGDNEIIEIRQVQEFADFPQDVQQVLGNLSDMQLR